MRKMFQTIYFCGLFVATPLLLEAASAVEPFSACELKQEYKVIKTESISPCIGFRIRVTNNNNTVLLLKDLELRYWYTFDGNASQSASVVFSRSNQNEITNTQVGIVSTTQGGQDHYVFVRFNTSAGSLLTGDTVEVEILVTAGGLGSFDQSNDFSFDASKTEYACWDRVTTYYRGGINCGDQPKTEIASDCSFKVQYMPGDTNLQSFRPSLWFLITNVDTTSHDLSVLTFEYWIAGGIADLVVGLEEATINSGSVDVKDKVRVVLNDAASCLSGQFNFITFSFSPHLFLGPGETLLIKSFYGSPAIQNKPFRQDKDYSFNGGIGVFSEWERIPVFCHSLVLCGQRPPVLSDNFDPAAVDFRCVLWKIQEETLGGLRSAEIKRTDTNFAVPAVTPTPQIFGSSVYEHRLVVMQPHYLKSMQSMTNPALESVFVRNDSYIGLKVGADKKTFGFEGVEPGVLTPDWIYPKHLTKPYDVFSRFDFSFESSDGDIAIWRTTTASGENARIYVDLDEMVILKVEIDMTTDGYMVSVIDNAGYSVMNGATVLTSFDFYCRKSDEPGAKKAGTKIEYEYTNINRTVELNEFELE